MKNKYIALFASILMVAGCETLGGGGSSSSGDSYISYTSTTTETFYIFFEDSPKNNCGDEILSNVLNTPGLIRVTSQDHLGSYSDLISNIPGISNYFSDKFEIE